MNTVERAVNAWAAQSLVHGSDAYIRTLSDLHAEACKYGFRYVYERFVSEYAGQAPEVDVEGFATELRTEFISFFFGN